MALTLDKLGLQNGPPKQPWYLKSAARPWNDGESTLVVKSDPVQSSDLQSDESADTENAELGSNCLPSAS